MQQAQQQTKRRRPHYNLCGRVENTTPIITLEEAREKLAKEKEKFKEMCEHTKIFNDSVIKLAEKANLPDMIWETFDSRTPQEKLSYLGYMEVLEILANKYKRTKLRKEIEIMNSN